MQGDRKTTVVHCVNCKLLQFPLKGKFAVSCPFVGVAHSIGFMTAPTRTSLKRRTSLEVANLRISEREFLALVDGFFKSLDLRPLGFLVDGVGNDVDRSPRLGGARVFAGTATNTDLVVELGDHQVPLIRHHADGFGRTMLGTRSTSLFLRNHDTIFFDKYRLPDLDLFLRCSSYREDRTTRTDLRAKDAIIIAIAGGVVHLRLEDARDPVFKERRIEDLSRTDGDAEMAGSAET